MGVWLRLSAVEDRVPLRGQGSWVCKGIHPEILAREYRSQRNTERGKIIVPVHLCMEEMGGAGIAVHSLCTHLCSMQPGRVVTLVPKEEVRTICTICEINPGPSGHGYKGPGS